MPELFPIATCSSILHVSTETEGFALHVANDGGERTFRAHIAFEVGFVAAPLVHVGLAGFDIDHGASSRLTLRAESITPSGFNVVLTTWLDTKVYAAAVSWLAIGQPSG